MGSRADHSKYSLLLDEYFDREDDRFVQTLCRVRSGSKIAALANRLINDKRPWARKQIVKYLAEPMNCPGHQPMVKRLFKNADRQHDDELMALFLVNFDRLVRHRRRNNWRWDNDSRRWTQFEEAFLPRNTIPGPNPKTGGKKNVSPYYYTSSTDRLFSYHTRYYLRRRAWRYFRWMGYQRPDQYVDNICRALALYKDSDFATGENILDNWGLVHACFGKHDALEFLVAKIFLKEGRSVSDLTPAPYFPELWKNEKAFSNLLQLLLHAKSRFVRLWAMQMMEKEHSAKIASIDVESLFKLLENEDSDLQQFASRLLNESSALANLPLDTWLKLLETENPTTLILVCDLFVKNVSPQRLDTDRCVTLTCARAIPVAKMGFEFLKSKSFETSEEQASLARLANAQSIALVPQITRFALSHLGSSGHYNREGVIGFFDGLSREMREESWKWLNEKSPGWNDPVLWSRLVETPYDDVRMHLVNALERRTALPGANPDDLPFVWASVLLGIHRGGRSKPKAISQIARAIEKKTERIDELGPVLTVAVRSIRGPEQRAGLAAIAGLVSRNPALMDKVKALLPEISFSTAGASA